jgi:hypothetical protein
MRLRDFDVRGERVYDEETEAVLRPGDPWRALVRYQDDGSELFVHARVNVDLLTVAASTTVVVLEPSPRPDELMPGDGLLTASGSERNYRFLEQLCDEIEAQGCPACYLAEAHEGGRRDFYFAAEDAPRMTEIAHRAAGALAIPLEIHERRLAAVAPTILPTELIGDLGLDVPAGGGMRKTRFEFWGAAASLQRLRDELERRGYRFLDIDLITGELRVMKEVPIDGPGFLAVLREIVPVARSLNCSYRGTETVAGADQFAPSRPLPERYAPARERGRKRLGRFFGR